MPADLLLLENIVMSEPTALLSADALGSTLGHHTRQAVHAFSYMAYGYAPATAVGLPITGFTGQYRDSATGCYLLGNGYRSYNPVLMRFASPDSRSPFGNGGINTYAYASGSPIEFGDPTGHTPEKLMPRGQLQPNPKHSAFVKKHKAELQKMDSKPYIDADIKGWWKNEAATKADLVIARKLVRNFEEYESNTRKLRHPGSMSSALALTFRQGDLGVKIEQRKARFVALANMYEPRDFANPPLPYVPMPVPVGFVARGESLPYERDAPPVSPPPSYDPPPSFGEAMSAFRTTQ